VSFVGYAVSANEGLVALLFSEGGGNGRLLAESAFFDLLPEFLQAMKPIITNVARQNNFTFFISAY